ncbi:MAG TPA: potassium channel protein [Acidimicrobiales bacterium]|jgi:voltage-gated potassium channel|nr:potassium channel protein [Acidimicrobiales bacterium]
MRWRGEGRRWRGESGLGTARRLRTGLLALLVIVVCGTAGFVGLGYSFVDALFQTIVTVTTVGFREVHNFGTAGELFSIFLILAGVGTAAYTFSVLVDSFVEGHLTDLVARRRMERRIEDLRGHLILCGWGRVGQAIARQVTGTDHDMVVVDLSPARLPATPALTVQGDATDDAVLRAAGIERAGVLVTALNADPENLYVTLTARSLCPDLFIVARANADASIDKLVQAGADRVVNPASIGGARMAAFALQPHVAEFVDVVMHDGSLEFRLEEVPVPQGSPLDGRTIGEARIRDRTGALVLATRNEDGDFTTNPGADMKIEAGHILIAIGTGDQLEALSQSMHP